MFDFSSNFLANIDKIQDEFELLIKVNVLKYQEAQVLRKLKFPDPILSKTSNYMRMLMINTTKTF